MNTYICDGVSCVFVNDFYYKRSTLFLIIFTTWYNEFQGSVVIVVLLLSLFPTVCCSVWCAEYAFVYVGSVYIRGNVF